ncbi:glycosyltransferase [candidate division TA06 bacterium]|nr:glycosyltransferase [candidate division TA06 bacterium]
MKKRIFYYSDQWDDKWRRRQQIAMRLSKLPGVETLYFIELPLSGTSLIKYLTGRADKESAQRWSRVFKAGFAFDLGKITIITPFSILPYFTTGALKGLNLSIVKWSIFSKLPKGFKPDVFWASLPFDALWLKCFKEYKLIYDCSEQFSEFDNWRNIKKSIIEWDNQLTKEADQVFVQTEYLRDIKTPLNKNIAVMPNAVDEKVFSLITDGDLYNSLKDIPKPVLGYVGSINYRLDLELIKAIAKEKPDWSIVLVGNKSLDAQIDWPKNVYFIDGMEYTQMPGTIASFDVCLLPHLANKLVDSESPIKLFDYMATGKPIVSQNLAGVRPYKDYVYLAENKDQFIAAIEKALKEDETSQTKRKEYGLTQNWDNRVNQIKDYL